jgi:hypothetical protein
MVARKTGTSKTAAKKVARRASPITRTPVADEMSAGPVTLEASVVLPRVDKQDLIRDSFTMPKAEYELLAALKGRLLLLATSTKKSELLRAGVVALALMSDAELLAAVTRIPSLKTGRPKTGKAAKKKA